VPFLRVIRDKRGYETTYLMDWHREGDRQRSHILYVFRTPGGARVGREPLDPEARREIEQRYPDISFDWNAVLKTQQIVEAPPERRPRRRRRPEDQGEAGPGEGRAPSDAGSPATASPVPALIEGTTPDERVAFLAHWYPLLKERIQQRNYEPARREALAALAERLNPGLWSDADQISSGLQLAAEALDRLSRVLAKRRRRGRRSASSGPGVAPAPEGAGAADVASPPSSAQPEASSPQE
jgi:hypothetical protein